MMVEVEAYRYHETMSDDGVEDEADHEERRKYVDSFCCYLYRNLVVISEMVMWTE